MLPKTYRLPASQKLQHSQFFKSPIFLVKVSVNNQELSRFGFIAKKTMDKRAVVRNRAKRVLRSCIEELKSNIKTGYDMLFFLEKGIIGKEREEVFKEVHILLANKKFIK